MDKQGNSTYLTIDPPENDLQGTKSTQILKKNYTNQKPCETTQNHRKTSNVTEMKHESHKKSKNNRIIKNQKETSEDNRQNPPLDLILSRIQRSLQKLRHGKMARNNPLPCSDVGLHHPSFLG